MTYITKRSGFHLVDHLAVCARARVPEISGSTQLLATANLKMSRVELVLP